MEAAFTAPVSAEPQLLAWLGKRGFAQVPAGEGAGGIRSVGPAETWYRGSAGTRRPLTVVLHKTPELNVSVVWDYAGHAWFRDADEKKARAFIAELKAWRAEP